MQSYVLHVRHVNLKKTRHTHSSVTLPLTKKMLSILDIVSANTIYYCYPALVPTSKRVYGDSAV
jgi:hypothetical protein